MRGEREREYSIGSLQWPTLVTISLSSCCCCRLKQKTTREIASSFGIESRVQPDPSVTPSVTDLVPDENKSELMDRFLSSQKPEDEDSRDGAPS